MMTDTVQLINLALFVAGLMTALYIAWQVPRLRWWLLPVIAYLSLGVAFYVIAVGHLLTSEIRTGLSAGLRLYGVTSVLAALAVLWAMAKDWDDKG